MERDSPTAAAGRSTGQRRLDAAGYALAALFTALAVHAVVSEPPRSPHPPLDPGTRAAIGRAFAAREPMLRARARRDFPGHLWAQSDHFAGMEQDFMRAEARRRRTNIGDVALAIDEDLRAHPPDGVARLAGAAPCKPLPFYD